MRRSRGDEHMGNEVMNSDSPWDVMIESRAIARWKHRIRTPLNQIVGYVELLEETLPGELSENLLPRLQKMEAACREIAGLMAQVLDGPEGKVGVRACDSLTKALELPVTRLETACERCQEIAEGISGETLNLDLVEIGESIGRLRKALGSLNAKADHMDAEVEQAVAASAESRTSSPFGVVDPHAGAKLLLVDDDRINRVVIERRLSRMGFNVIAVDGGREALKVLARETIELVMLDILMPEMDGFATLDRIKADRRWASVPVIMLTSLDDADSVARCLSNGAEDYVSKPFDATVLRARIDVSLDRKRLRDQEKSLLASIQLERNKSEDLLNNILPSVIAERLKAGEKQIVDRVPAATVLFADIVGFTSFSATNAPEKTMALLNALFSAFDRLVESLGLEKIKTIGDAYLAVAGVPELVPDHAERGARMALAMLAAVETFNIEYGLDWSVRIGMHSGSLMAGIIGSRKFAYDLWGDTVNVASLSLIHI